MAALPCLHIGFHKSASTTLQQYLLARHSQVKSVGRPVPDARAKAACDAVLEAAQSRQPLDVTKYRALWQQVLDDGAAQGKCVMLFNNARCTALTPEYVNTASGLELHQFKWLGDDSLIGELPESWNHLVGVAAPSAEANLVHYTIGGPYFHEYHGCEFTDEWMAEKQAMLRCDQRDT